MSSIGYEDGTTTRLPGAAIEDFSIGRRMAAISFRSSGAVTHEAPVGESLGQRILMARLEVSAVLQRYISQDAFGELVGEETPEKAPYRGATVSRWEADLQEPAASVLLAVCRACRRVGVNVDPGWLMAGAESDAPPPRSRQAEQARPLANPRRRGSRNFPPRDLKNG